MRSNTRLADWQAALARGHRLLEADPTAALAHARSMCDVGTQDSAVHRLIGQALRRLDRLEEAESAEMQAISLSGHNEAIARTVFALKEGRLVDAEGLIRAHLENNPDDPAALLLLAEIAHRSGAEPHAEALFRRALSFAPAYQQARLALANSLSRQSRFIEAIAEFDRLLTREPASIRYRSLKALALARNGDFAAALELYDGLTTEKPDSPSLWQSRGHVLKTLGRTADSLASYRQAIILDPLFGEAYWSIANLKAALLSDADMSAMGGALKNSGLTNHQKLHFHFALGSGLEARKKFDASFDHYTAANALRRKQLRFDPDAITGHVDSVVKKVTPARMARSSSTCGRGAIFVIGMPRAGSTLIEQILASHPEIEGTSELPYVPELAMALLSQSGPRTDNADALMRASDDMLARLGADYMTRAGSHRKTGRPLFIDKLPNNWMHVPLILAVLPEAKVIDARRHPLACGFSNFKQHYAQGQEFSYSLDSIGRYYTDYVRLMAHIDRLMPGRIHRVVHEHLLDDPEREVRSIFDYLGLYFDPACLRFYENDRAVRTASAEQVRQPLNRRGQDAWKPYDEWLGPLRTSLGGVLSTYPGIPAFPDPV